MKRIAIISICAFQSAFGQEDRPPLDSFHILSPVEVKAVRAGELAPFTRTNLDKKAITKLNQGQDIPFLLNHTPSVVANSDAGNGIGYTGIRIRGVDATRINVTLNGIPYNDAESQGTFFVDLPDFSSSASSIQIQRGVGTSSNGAGAFGASIHISTNEVNKQAYASIGNSYGSFDTWKHTVKAGTGLINDQFTTDVRLSYIHSNGFIDRATSGLKSVYFTTAYLGTNNSVRLNIFSGKEKTYQAWYGISETDLFNGNRTINYAGMEKPGTPYENETDNFKQDHYQLFFDQRLNSRLVFNTAIFLTKGEGYYEQYRAGEEYARYNLILPGNSDFIRQLWLDNDFYGNIFSLQYKGQRSESTLGGAITRYDGNHFGELIWASNGLPEPKHRWYDHDARKNDFTVYLKEQYSPNEKWTFFGDLQYRRVDYRIQGFRDHPAIIVDNTYNFFNPKAGVVYKKENWKTFLSYSHASKEPNRDDFEAGLAQQPLPEKLHDVEAGIQQRKKNNYWGVTLYYMFYKDQLVLTGQINDVGAYTRTNIPKSYRAGIELEGSYQYNQWVNFSGNLSLSRNRVNNFPEYIDDYDNGGQQLFQYRETDLAFSPAVVGSATLTLHPSKSVEIALLNKYVSDQYLDNTSQQNKQLDAFFVQDLRLTYSLKTKFIKSFTLTGQLQNLWDRKYEPNGYTFSYIVGGEKIAENYYFPMAGRNFMIGLNIDF